MGFEFVAVGSELAAADGLGRDAGSDGHLRQSVAGLPARSRGCGGDQRFLSQGRVRKRGQTG